MVYDGIECIEQFQWCDDRWDLHSGSRPCANVMCACKFLWVQISSLTTKEIPTDAPAWVWRRTWRYRDSLIYHTWDLQYIPRNMHTVFALPCFVVVIHWLIFPYPSGLLHWHCGNLTIAPVPAKQPWWIWINTSCKFIMNDCVTTTKQSTTKPCAYF